MVLIFFTNRFDQEFNPSMYHDIHHETCKHFRGKANDTICNVDEIDRFRTKEENCNFSMADENIPFKGITGQLKSFEICKDFINKYLESIAEPEPSNTPSFWGHFHKSSFSEEEKSKAKEQALAVKKWLVETVDPSCEEKEFKEIYKILSDKVVDLKEKLKVLALEQSAALNKEFAAIAKRLSLDLPFVDCYAVSGLDYKTLRVEYLKPIDSGQCEEITKKLFAEFQTNLNELQKNTYLKIQTIKTKDLKEQIAGRLAIKADYQENVIKLIARLYAELEWAHPWIDGQGRTDLIVLNGLLCREGMHPCILDEPYFSTGNDVEQWITYLKQGLARFEQVQQQSIEKK